MASVKTKEIEIVGELSKLGLTEEILAVAIQEGEIAKDSCTANDPVCLPGFTAWGRTVRSLRDQLIPIGWTRNDEKNYPTVVSPNGKIALAVATGDEGTGQADSNPSTAYPKGSVTQDAVVRNQRALFDLGTPKKSNCVTWMLLKRRVKNTVFAELSLPAVITDSGAIIAWEMRIVLEPIILDTEITIVDDLPEEVIEIAVSRKA